MNSGLATGTHFWHLKALWHDRVLLVVLNRGGGAPAGLFRHRGQVANARARVEVALVRRRSSRARHGHVLPAQTAKILASRGVGPAKTSYLPVPGRLSRGGRLAKRQSLREGELADLGRSNQR